MLVRFFSGVMLVYVVVLCGNVYFIIFFMKYYKFWIDIKDYENKNILYYLVILIR